MTMTEKEFIQLVTEWYHYAKDKCGLQLGSLDEVAISPRARKWLGQCSYYLDDVDTEKHCRLVFSKALLQLPIEAIVNTVVHELCHMVRFARSHDNYWWDACNTMMKAFPNLKLDVCATKEETVLFYKALPKRKVYKLTCPTCGHVWKYYRLGKTVKYALQGQCRCPKCNTKLIVEEGRE